jgi:hypothetical protein
MDAIDSAAWRRVPVVVGLRHRGSPATKTSASLLLDGRRAENRGTALKWNGTVEEVFHVSHKAPGLYRYEVRADALAAYQIVILGRNAEVFLTDDALAKLRKWLVESEGSLVCFRGPAAIRGQSWGLVGTGEYGVEWSLGKNGIGPISKGVSRFRPLM